MYHCVLLCTTGCPTSVNSLSYHNILCTPPLQPSTRADLRENKNLVGNALLSLVNLYAQVTKKCPIFYSYKSMGLVYLIYMVD